LKTTVILSGAKDLLFASTSSTSTPITPVERTVLNCLGNMRYRNRWRALQVGNRPRNLENAIMRARCKPLLLHGTLQQPLCIWT
jgi:hypothetical protein